MLARLLVFPPLHPARHWELEAGRTYRLGRDPDCELTIDDERVSRQHARLRWEGSGWQVADLDSKNGTAVDGMRIRDETALVNGTLLSFGGLSGRFELLSDQRLQDENRVRLERWQSSIELRRGLQPTLGLETLLSRLLDSVLSLSGADRGFVLLSGSDGELAIAATGGVSEEDLRSSEFSGSVGAVEQALSQGTAVALSDALADPALGSRPSVLAGGIRGLLCLPLTARGQILGVIYVDSKKPGVAFTNLDVEILESLSSHASLAISVARIDRDLKRLASGLAAAPAIDTGELAEQLDRLRERGLDEGPGGLSWNAVVAAHRRPQGEGS